jgi:outer membrane immunogenic protein
MSFLGAAMKFVLVVLTLAGSISAVAAADVLPAPAPSAPPVYRPPPVTPAYNWSGFYVGAMGGYGWSTSQGNDFKGGFAGGTVGANAQFQNFVVGVETEGAWSNIGQSATAFFGLLTAKDQVQAFGSVTGRLGLAVDSLLIYGKGGYAFAANNIRITGPGGFVSDTQFHNGYTVGGGIEYGVTPNVSIKGEYLFAHYLSQNYFASIAPPGVASGALDVHTVKLGVNYRFGWNNQPVVARY